MQSLSNLARAFALATVMCSSFAHAAYPESGKPIHLVVGFPPGGGADVLARAIEPGLAKELGTNVIVENRPGASGVIATDYVARSLPDGYTIYLVTPGSLTILPNLQKVPYDPAHDFTAISLLVNMPNVLVASPALGIKNVKDLLAKAHNGGDFTYATGGNGTIGQMAAEQFNLMAHTTFRQVPYRGTTPALIDVMSGLVTLTFSDPSVKNMVEGGKLQALAVTGAHRSAQFPGVPTVAEAGIAGYELTNWYGIIGPKGMDPAVLSTLNAALNKAVTDPAVVRTLAGAAAMEVATGTPTQFANLMAAERTKWADLIVRAGIKDSPI
jgi:tripartite-type tricarboxylate transporter receptor subunit TctC